MRCRAARKLIHGVLAGELAQEQRLEMLDHAAGCPRCRERLTEAELARDALAQAAAAPAHPPVDLAARIKRSARELEAEHQIREAGANAALGSPAFVATCASVLVAAFMVYVVATQVYLKRMDARTVAGFGATPGRTRVADLRTDFTPARYQPAPAASATRPADAARDELSVLPAWAERASRGDGDRDAVRGRDAASGAGGPERPRRARRASAERRGKARARGEDAVAAGDLYLVPRPELKLASLQSAQAGSQQDLVAGLVAQVVVERYVAERLVTSEPALRAVTTSTSTAPAAPTGEGAGVGAAGGATH